MRPIHHESAPKATPTVARNAQNHAKPLASLTCTGSVMPSSDVKPVTAKPRLTAAKKAAMIVASFAEIFMIEVQG